MAADLTALGWSEDHAEAFAPYVRAGLEPARVTAVHRGGVVLSPSGRLAPVAGALLHRAEAFGGEVLPVVGDWVAAEPEGAVVHVLERHGTLARAGARDEVEVLAANVDLALAVSSLNLDLSLRRLERLVALARDGGVEARVLLTKADLGEVPEVGLDVPVLAISARTGEGMDALRGWLEPGRTIALLGMSGVGKSTLVNTLLGEERQRTAGLRADDRGRHATTHRELFVLPGGALLIDTPGIRSVAPAGGDGIDETFADIAELAEGCRFADCAHAAEPGCAVAAAIADGSLDAERLEAMRKLERDVRRVEEAVAQRRSRERSSGRRYRDVLKDKHRDA